MTRSGSYDLDVLGGKGLGIRMYAMNILTILVFLLIALWLHSEISNRLYRLSEYHSQTISLNHRVLDMSGLLQMGLVKGAVR